MSVQDLACQYRLRLTVGTVVWCSTGPSISAATSKRYAGQSMQFCVGSNYADI